MPELPEVETSRRGITPYIADQRITDVVIRERRLRWPIPIDIEQKLWGQSFYQVTRRGKYLLLYTANGCAILHLGMSGSLRIVSMGETANKHDHVDIGFENGYCLRLTDPRRFGCLLWTKGDPLQHKLLQHLGPEPLTEVLSGDYLYQLSRGKKAAVKTWIMDSQVVVGVGNIYANEALFAAGIHPKRLAGKISRLRYHALSEAIKQILQQAIAAGGTTLRDFLRSDGKPGYFTQSLAVYGRAGDACLRCQKPLSLLRLGQRSTVYCSRCQR